MPPARAQAGTEVATCQHSDSTGNDPVSDRRLTTTGVMATYGQTLRVAFLSVFVTLVVAPIAMLPYRADDTINRTNGAFSWSADFHGLVKLNRDWIRDEGRFFPGGSIYGLPMWHLLDTRAAYLTYLVLLNLACFALVAFVCFRVTRSADITVIAVIAFGACMQIRWWWFDGLSSFAGLIPYTIVLTVLSGLGVAQYLRTGQRWWLIPTALAWTLVITTYEVILLLLPAIAALLFVVNQGRTKRQWTWALAPLVIPAVAEFLISIYLRSLTPSNIPAYEINRHGPVGITFLKQLTAALPSSQYWLGGTPKGIHLGPTLSVLLVVTLALPAFLVWRPHFAVKAIPLRISAGLTFAGAWVWLVPSLLTGLTKRWQDELIFGQGYIYLPYEYVGIALIAAGVTGLLAGMHRSRGVRIAVVSLLALFLIGTALTVESNILYAGQYVIGPQNSDLPATSFWAR